MGEEEGEEDNGKYGEDYSHRMHARQAKAFLKDGGGGGGWWSPVITVGEKARREMQREDWSRARRRYFGDSCQVITV